MCDQCRQDFCPSACPNYIEKLDVLYVCKRCRYKIRVGDYAYKIDDDTVICDNCMVEIGFYVQ